MRLAPANKNVCDNDQESTILLCGDLKNFIVLSVVCECMCVWLTYRVGMRFLCFFVSVLCAVMFVNICLYMSIHLSLSGHCYICAYCVCTRVSVINKITEYNHAW